MRPDIDSNGEKLYECFKCGERTSSPEAGCCPNCGAELLNLERARDL